VLGIRCILATYIAGLGLRASLRAFPTRRAGKDYQKGNQKKKATKKSQKGEPERIVVSKNSQHPAKPIQNWNSNGAKFGVNVLRLILMVLGVQIFADVSFLNVKKRSLAVQMPPRRSRNVPRCQEATPRHYPGRVRRADLGLWRRRYGELTGACSGTLCDAGRVAAGRGHGGGGAATTSTRAAFRAVPAWANPSHS